MKDRSTIAFGTRTLPIGVLSSPLNRRPYSAGNNNMIARPSKSLRRGRSLLKESFTIRTYDFVSSNLVASRGNALAGRSDEEAFGLVKDSRSFTSRRDDCLLHGLGSVDLFIAWKRIDRPSVSVSRYYHEMGQNLCRTSLRWR